MTSKVSALLIAGPTASGKSDFALNLAEKLDGVIVNADSMQVYKDLQVLTARPGERDLARVPHRLYGHVDGAENYSTGKWLEDVRGALEGIKALEKLPIIVGGTGLYFKALLEGLANIPDIDGAIRQTWREALVSEGPEALHQKLIEVDSALASRISPSDGQRIIRGLEVFEATGTPLSAWHKQGHEGAVIDLAQTYPMVISCEREDIYKSCDERLDLMLRSGALKEVEALLARELEPSLPVMKVIGVPQLGAYLRGEMSLIDASEKIKTLTRRYAKRQLTWLRRNMISWNHVFAQDSESISLDILPKLRKNS